MREGNETEQRGLGLFSEKVAATGGPRAGEGNRLDEVT